MQSVINWQPEPIVYEIERNLAADLPQFITDHDITVLKRRATSANLKLNTNISTEGVE